MERLAEINKMLNSYNGTANRKINTDAIKLEVFDEVMSIALEALQRSEPPLKDNPSPKMTVEDFILNDDGGSADDMPTSPYQVVC